MDLLLEIKKLYSLLFDVKIIQDIPNLQELENIAEKCFHKDYKQLNNFLISGLSCETYDKIKQHIKKIKELTK